MAEQLRKAVKSRPKQAAARTVKRSGHAESAKPNLGYDKEPPKLDRVSVWDMVNNMKRDPSILIDAEVLGWRINEHGIRVTESRRITDRDKFLKLFDNAQVAFRETDSFGTDQGNFVRSNNLVGDDFIPLLGGPFNKQLYLHDMLEQQGLAFFAYHHDPIAYRGLHIIRDFTLGKGWGTNCENDTVHSVWQAFEKANDLQGLFRYLAIELGMYGEVMVWWLPDHDTKIEYQLKPSQQAPKGLLPRVRLLDPSMVWEIVTYPEDITRVLYYQIVSPTQYQIYTGKDGSGEYVPTLKYIFQQIPADQIMHYKVNTVSNEKRGRSDLYPIFGDLKRLRDTVDYSIIAMQKAAAWAMDTTIEGNQADLDAYVASQDALGTIAPAGSEFIHTSKVKREYQSNSAIGRGGGGNSTFDWVFSKICIGLGIPEHYFGLQKSGGSTRAGAIVATEPVAKIFEMRQQLFIGILNDMREKLAKEMNLTDAEVEFTFPEIITQDRSAKLKDLALCEINNWIANETAGTIAAKEMGIDTYEYEQEIVKIKSEDQEFRAPLSPQTPAAQNPAASGPVPKSSSQAAVNPLSTPGLSSKPAVKPKTVFDSTDKHDVRMNNGY